MFSDVRSASVRGDQVETENSRTAAFLFSFSKQKVHYRAMEPPGFEEPPFSRASASERLLQARNSFANINQSDDKFNEIAQSSGQRVLSKLRTRQLALSSSVKDTKPGQQLQVAKNESFSYQTPPVYARPPQPMPRKLEPLLPTVRDNSDSRSCEQRSSVRASR